MIIELTDFPGLYLIDSPIFKDNRGKFHKVFNAEILRKEGLECDFEEIYYSSNSKNVVRGMHFQLPPFEHNKLVYVSQGRIIDVVVDLRKELPSYGKFFSIELNASCGKLIYIPKGMAHGFCSLENETIVNYAQTSCYAPEADCGIDCMTFGYEWPIDNPIRSKRDMDFVALKNFKSPF